MKQRGLGGRGGDPSARPARGRYSCEAPRCAATVAGLPWPVAIVLYTCLGEAREKIPGGHLPRTAQHHAAQNVLAVFVCDRRPTGTDDCFPVDALTSTTSEVSTALDDDDRVHLA